MSIHYTSSIPTIILQKIFSYLHGQDIITATCVSRQWNDAVSTAPRLLENVNVVFNEITITPEHPYLDLFVNSKRKYPNLMLQSVKVTTYKELWIKLGANLKHLEIRKCRIELLTVLSLMRFCPVLETLIIDKMLWFTNNDKPTLQNALKSLPAEFSYLRTFSIHLSTLTCQFIKLLIMCMPNIETISICACCCCYSMPWDVREAEKADQWNLSMFNYLLTALLPYHRVPIKGIEYHGEIESKILEDLSRCRHLSLRKFKYFNCNTDEQQFDSNLLREFCDRHHDLEELQLFNFDLSDSDIILIADHLPKLQELRLSKNNFTSNALASLNKLRGLRVLQLGELNTSLNPLIFTDLSYLQLDLNVDVSESVIISDITLKYKDLTYLEIDSETSLSDKSVRLILSNMRQIQVLKLHNILNVTESAFFNGTRFHSIQGKIASSGTRSSLRRLTHLRELELSQSTKLGDSVLCQISKIQSLRKLLICCPKATKSGFEDFAKRSRGLQVLNLFGCDNLDTATIEIIIQKLEQLKDLKLIQCQNRMKFDIHFLLRNMKLVTWRGMYTRPRRTATIIIREIKEK